jgi:hypothetical protein
MGCLAGMQREARPALTTTIIRVTSHNNPAVFDGVIAYDSENSNSVE